MLPVDTNWQYTTNTFVEYPYLSPNDYQFIIEAALPNSLFGETPTVVELHIHKPWYKEWWFIMFSVLVFLLLLFLSIRKYLNTKAAKHQQKQQQLETEKQLLQLQQKALRLQLNPHFIFNTINAIKGAYSVGNVANAQKYIEHFSLLLRQILQTNDDGIITIAAEIEMLTNYLELNKLRTGNKFNYAISVSPSINATLQQIPNMIVQPFVENALLHGIAALPQNGFVSISFVQNHTTLQCIVEDNGIGRKQSQQMQGNKINTSKGISLTMQRLQLNSLQSNMNAVQIEDLEQNGKAIGTRVTISF